MGDEPRQAGSKTIFSQPQIHDLHQTIIAAGIAPTRLLDELDPEVRAILEQGASTQADWLLSILAQLNRLRLLDGSIPFRTVLETARLLAGPREERTKLEDALRVLEAYFGDRAGVSPSPAAGAPPRHPGGTPESDAMVTTARRWLIGASLAATAATLIFLILAPVLGYPMEYPENLRPMQLVLPVALGYLGSMTLFVFRPARVVIHRPVLPVIGLLVKGPTIVFGLSAAAVMFAFGYSNRSSAPVGASHMTLDQLSTMLTAGLAVLTVTTNAMVSYLFGTAAPGDDSRA